MENTPLDNTQLSKKWVTVIILSGWFLSVFATVTILIVALWMMMTGNGEIPKTLDNWAGIALGFLFGNVFNLVTKYIN